MNAIQYKKSDVNKTYYKSLLLMLVSMILFIIVIYNALYPKLKRDESMTDEQYMHHIQSYLTENISLTKLEERFFLGLYNELFKWPYETFFKNPYNNLVNSYNSYYNKNVIDKVNTSYPIDAKIDNQKSIVSEES